LGRRRTSSDVSQESREWLTTYGDLVTLLLTFFVLLFSFSTLDAQKWQQLVISLTGGRGVLDGANSIYDIEGETNLDDYSELLEENMMIDVQNPSNEEIHDDEADKFIKLYRDIELFLEREEIPAEIEISKEHTEILIRFKDSVLFDTGRADIKPEALEILNGIAAVLSIYQDDIDQVRVDGHADSRPINTFLYPTNWELSSKRAVNVVRYFCEEKGLEPSKLSAAAYGPFHPIDSNETEEGMARNRRVEIYITRASKPIGIINTEKE